MEKIGKLKTYSSKEIEESYVGIDFCCLDRELFKAEKCYELLGKTGIKYARVQTGWSKCEKEKGVYTFEWLDSVIENLCNQGVKTWLSVTYGNPIYMPDLPNPTGVGCVPLYYGEEVLNAWKNFVTKIVERYKDRVTHYEIWNEPNAAQFWHPSEPDGAEYAKLVNVTADVIHSVQKDAKIVCNTAGPQAFGFLNDLFDNVKKENLNVYAYHVYTKVPEFRTTEATAQVRKMLKSKGFCDVEFWQGESGYPSWAYEGHWLVKEGCNDEMAQAVYQLRRYFIDVFNGVKLSSYFQMADMWENAYEKKSDVIQKCAAHGILNGLTYTPKKSYETITNLSTIFSGDIKPTDDYMLVDVNAKSVIDLIACRKMTFEKNGIPIYAYYYPSNLAERAEIPFDAKITILENLDTPILIDPMNGDVFEVRASNSVKYNYGHIEYKLPIKEYPLILTDKKAFKIV